MREAFQLTSDEAQLQLTLDNSERYGKLFSPESTAGAYYGKLLPLRPIKIDCIYAGGTATMYRGWVDTFTPTINERGDRVCVVQASGAKQFLQDAEVYIDLMQNVTADEVLAEIFEQVIFPPSLGGAWLLGLTGFTELGVTTYLTELSTEAYDFEVGATTFAYVGDSWENGVNAYAAIERLMRSERGRFFFDRSGKAIFLNHSNFQTHYANDGTVDNKMADAVYDYGAEVKNVIRVGYAPRQITAGTVLLWALDSAVRVQPGATRTIRARYTDDGGGQVAGMNVGTPTITADSGIVLDSFTATARSAELAFVNNGLAVGEVTAADIYGQKITTWNRVEVQELDLDSWGNHGKRVLPLECDLIDNEDDARSIAQYELLRRRDPRGMMRTITMLERTTDNSSLMFNRTIADRLRVVENQTEHDQDYFIVGEEWELTNNLMLAKSTWSLEPASSVLVWLIEVAGHSELEETTYIGF